MNTNIPPSASDPVQLQLNALQTIIDHQQRIIADLWSLHASTYWAILSLFAVVIVLCFGVYLEARKADRRKD